MPNEIVQVQSDVSTVEVEFPGAVRISVSLCMNTDRQEHRQAGTRSPKLIIR